MSGKALVVSNKELFSLIGSLVHSARRQKEGDITAEILSVLRDHLPIQACTFYSINDFAVAHEDGLIDHGELIAGKKRARLNLRAQIGLNYNDYESFSLSLNSAAGKCILSSKIEVYSDVRKRKDYRDKSLCNKFDLRKMMAIPLYGIRPRGNQEDPIGVICIYPEKDASMASLRRVMEVVSPIISEVYVLEIERDQLRFRSTITKKAVASVDLNSFLFRACRVLKEEWPYEAISVLLFDERSRQLRLAASTGVLGDRPKLEVLIDPERDQCTESECFNESVPVLEMYSGSEAVIDQNADRVHSVIAARLLLPIFEPSSNGLPKRPLGVLRVTNKLLRHDKRTEVFYFGWEDIEFLNFVCDVLGVIAAMLNRVSSSKDDFERALHGVQNNLVGLIGSLEFVSTVLARNLDNHRYRYVLPTASVQLQALSWQIERFARRDFIDNDENMACNLLSDVFAKLGPILRPLGTSLSVADLDLPNFNEVLAGIPIVACNPKDALIVFRNLFENSLKYAQPNKRARIDIKWSKRGDLVEISFSDYGIGISKKDSDRVFQEGYRSEDAIRRRSTGAGLGLHQCQELMRRTGGGIVLNSSSNPTTFLVTFKVYK